MTIPDIFNCHSPLQNAEIQNQESDVLEAESRKISELVFTISDTPKCVPNVHKTAPICYWDVRVAMTILIETTSENKTQGRKLSFRSTVRCWSVMCNLYRSLFMYTFLPFPKLNHVGQLVGFFGNVAKQCYLQVDILPDSKMYLSVAGLTRTSATFAYTVETAPLETSVGRVQTNI